MWIHKSAKAKSRFFTGHNTTCGSETTYIQELLKMDM